MTIHMNARVEFNPFEPNPTACPKPNLPHTIPQTPLHPPPPLPIPPPTLPGSGPAASGPGGAFGPVRRLCGLPGCREPGGGGLLAAQRRRDLDAEGPAGH